MCTLSKETCLVEYDIVMFQVTPCIMEQWTDCVLSISHFCIHHSTIVVINGSSLLLHPS